ncbi:A/G-specific adenine glycosylase [Aquibacillus halophilus]|uniref:Adenine DNA glycosylase n=1 Tax=Aquibacillus halophilus TaxID=930132 RepID=A0A6A8DTW2_9BACI|nr:A/G-specific adenine glycosylase [Aquibacillus halophilus]MRH44662.1 A/G-specific adenine glycosylase [Aquibacillus halophilus]
MKNNPLNDYLKNFKIEAFQHDLIDWFQKEQRDLPWRQDKDPYKIWVSEIMLQQTKVDTVIPYFNQFIEKFPTLVDLADANEQEVLKAWEGLGYYSRARNLQNAVREVVTSYDSKIPQESKQLALLKGVGPYTKGAILSIAYDIPEPAVDGNVMRVFSRLLMIDHDISKQSVRRLFEQCVSETISQDNPSAFNQGLMELGALICTPKKPSCMLCPVQEHCKAYHNGVQEQLPVKTKKKKQKEIPYLVFVIQDDQGNILIEQRPEEGLLANMWQFPMIPLFEVDLEHSVNWIEQKYGIKVSVENNLEQIKHVFSHLIWQLGVYKAGLVSGNLSEKNAVLVPKNELANYPFPVSHQKILKHLI